MNLIPISSGVPHRSADGANHGHSLLEGRAGSAPGDVGVDVVGVACINHCVGHNTICLKTRLCYLNLNAGV